MKFLALSIALFALSFSLSGCSYLDKFHDDHNILREANKAEVKMDKALAVQASGSAMVVKGKSDYSDAKKQRDDALEKLADSLGSK